MSKRAEEAALKAYPDYRSWDGGYVTQRKPRTYYIKGYDQAVSDVLARLDSNMTLGPGDTSELKSEIKAHFL